LLTARLGTTDLETTRVGLGAWAIGGSGWQGGWGPQDDAESVLAIHHAVDCGINWIDTAAAYGLGHAEEVVGEALRQLPEGDRPYVFTKCGLVWEPGATTVSNVLAPDSIRRECDDSLRRLGTDRIDLYQIHWPATDGTPIEDSWATMVELVEAGKVGAIGVSNFDVELLERCEAVGHVDSFQPELNLLSRDAAGTTLPWCEAHGTGVIVYSPMRSGLLTGRFTEDRAQNLPDDDWRSGDPDFNGEGLAKNLVVVDRLRAIADELGCGLPALVVAWTLAWPGVTGAIVGARRPDQVDDWVEAGSVQLGPGHLEEIAAVLDATGAGSGPTLPATA
ncbi:MAG TPA: aldo/keto reductase, partial [Acidimicrobiales bacterium]|nr:aldo/keto reductase [Acidimicrobiales bacterium]